MYTALYRAQRPEVFSEILGQDHIVKILKNQISAGTVSHAYLFCGTRGTGKTTTARILAKAVNCLEDGDVPCGHCANCMAIKDGNFMDVIEIDAASNNGVDNIRELRESVKYPPAVGRKKVYIIDEVHMLSTGAFNALLKTLEEPPESVMFILATTDPQKLPQTILSRCMRLDFKRVADKTLIEHMRKICAEKEVSVTDSALRLLAANADGSVRDGLSILDQCLAAGDSRLDRDAVLEFLGAVSQEFFIELTEKVSVHDVAAALVVLDGAMQEGKDVKQLMKDWMAHYRNLLITKYIKNPEDMLNMSSENIDRLRDQSNRISVDEINSAIVTLSRTVNDARYSTQPRVLMELAIVTIASGMWEGSSLSAAAPKRQAVSPAPAGKSAQPGAPVQTPTPPYSARAEEPDSRQEEPKAAKPVETVANTNDIADVDDTPCSAAKDFDLDELWGRIFEEGEGLKGSFNLIRTGATLAEIGNHEFKVIARSDFTKGYVEDNSADICRIMEKLTGLKLKLVCRTESAREDDAGAQTAEDIAKEVNDKLGIEVKVE